MCSCNDQLTASVHVLGHSVPPPPPLTRSIRGIARREANCNLKFPSSTCAINALLYTYRINKRETKICSSHIVAVHKYVYPPIALQSIVPTDNNDDDDDDTCCISHSAMIDQKQTAAGEKNHFGSMVLAVQEIIVTEKEQDNDDDDD